MQDFYNLFRQIIIYFLSEIFNTKDCVGYFGVVVPKQKAYEIIDWVKYCYAEEVEFHEFYLQYLEILKSIPQKKLRFIYSKFGNYTEKTASTVYSHYANVITSQGFETLVPDITKNSIFKTNEILINNLVLLENINVKKIKSLKDVDNLLNTFKDSTNKKITKKIEKYLPEIDSVMPQITTYLLDFKGHSDEEQTRLLDSLNQPL